MVTRWESVSDPFNFDLDLSHDLLAEAIAKETWNADFWKKLRGYITSWALFVAWFVFTQIYKLIYKVI